VFLLAATVAFDVLANLLAHVGDQAGEEEHAPHQHERHTQRQANLDADTGIEPDRLAA
jgi:hypothetical protein